MEQKEKPVKATFDYAVQYTVTATCKSPLRTGGANGNVDEVLCDQNGVALVQGSSLAGAVRGWMEGQSGAKKALAVTLFGSQERGGQLTFTDGAFEDNAQVQIRPRLAIDGEKGVAKDKAKFDVAHVNVGSVFSFCVFWMGMHGQQQPTCDALEDAFAALHRGDIRLGGQKSNGFGRVELEVRRAEYDMRDPNDRKAWIRENKAGEAVSLERTIPCEKRTVFTVTGTTDDLLVKAGYSDHKWKGKNDVNITEAHGVKERKKEGEEGNLPEYWVIPASSIKGAVRARMSAIAGFKGVSRETLDLAFGRVAEQGTPDAEQPQKDNGLAGKVRFSDVNLEQDTEGNSNAKKLTRIRIGRVTGGTVPGALFFQSPLSSRKIMFTVSVPEELKEVRALLLYALRDLGLGLYNLGSGYAVGRGYVNVEKIEVSDSDGKKATVTFQKGKTHTEGSAALLQDILNSLEVKRDV